MNGKQFVEEMNKELLEEEMKRKQWLDEFNKKELEEKKKKEQEAKQMAEEWEKELWERETNKEQLAEKCCFYANEALKELRKCNRETEKTQRIQQILIAHHNTGKRDAYLEMLDIVDSEMHDTVREKTEEKISKVLAEESGLM